MRFNELFRDPLQLLVLGSTGCHPSARRLAGGRRAAACRHTAYPYQHPAAAAASKGVGRFWTCRRIFATAMPNRYYPVAIMGEHLVDWLDRSIVSGRVLSVPPWCTAHR